MATTKLKQKWTTEEEEALCFGVGKHGPGRWKTILSDPQFSSTLANRSNVDLKDKWRNLIASGNCLSIRHNIRPPPGFEGVVANPLMSSLEPSSTVPLLECSEMGESSKRLLDRRTAPEFEAMIYEALLSMEDSSGSDINEILNFIEERYELPENYQKSIASKLRRLVAKRELEIVGNRYQINDAAYVAITTKLAAAHSEYVDDHNNGQPPQNASRPRVPRETTEDRARAAARMIALTENTKRKVINGSKEADECVELLKETEIMLEIAKELHEKCARDGHVRLAS